MAHTVQRDWGMFGPPDHYGLSVRQSLLSGLDVGDTVFGQDWTRLAAALFSTAAYTGMFDADFPITSIPCFPLTPQNPSELTWHALGPLIQLPLIITSRSAVADILLYEMVDISHTDEKLEWKSPGKVVHTGQLRQPKAEIDNLKEMAKARTKITINDWFDSLRNRGKHGISTRRHGNQL